MGKQRRSRAQPNRANPIAKPVKPPADPELAALREAKILPVLKDLQSPDPKSRTAAAGAIANIVQDTKCRKLLLREQVVPIVLTETLTDSSIDSRAAGWEILRELMQEEEADFCVHLYRLDILTAIEHATKSIIETLTASEPSFTKLLKAQQRLVWNMTSSLLSLLGALSVARDEILGAIVANHTILRFLFRLVSTDSIPQEVFEEALSCLMTMSEDNFPLGQAITDDQETRCYDQLLKLQAAGGPRSVLACGVLHNVFSSLQWLDHSPGKDGACDALLVPTLSRALEPITSSGGKTNGHGTPNEAGIAQVALEILASIGTDMQVTLEKGNRPQPGAKTDEEWNGIDETDAMEVDGGSDEDDGDNDDKDGSGKDDDDLEGDDDGDEDDDDEDGIADLDADMERVTGADDIASPGDLNDLPTMRELIRQAVPQLIRLTKLTIHNEDDMAVQAHAFSALNNIAWTFSCIEFADGENANIFAVWAPAAKKIWRKTIAPILEADNADLKLATLVASLAWAVARSLNGETPTDGTQHRRFMALYEAAKRHDAASATANETAAQTASNEDKEQEDPFQSLSIKCIGVLGSLAGHPADVNVNREVGVFLMTLLSHADTPAVDVIESLDQIYDIYGDEEAPCDKVFWNDGFLKHLEDLTPRLKTIAKGIDKRKMEELRLRADEVVLNLARFIQYKKKHAPC
ncbi:hypothetical protein B0H67DRAFT_488783 [Lasiosphaeris hirsuta]|uniref:SYO1-like TPR repeats domain-containing protein n=1 Tax=Lasiosphaeris hirsuta TaxID=260670 RepID=A0AA40AH18_9PEZI|nr:hypothetical protein B0H67DRAFT_488783 [Lasiosphaeris hirsuta]